MKTRTKERGGAERRGLDETGGSAGKQGAPGGVAGQVLLAFGDPAGEKHEQVRRQGHAAGAGGLDPETSAVACPVFGAEERLFGALAVSGPRYRLERLPLERVLTTLFREARALTLALGGNAEKLPLAGEGRR